MAQLKSPNGTRITGRADTVLATAGIIGVSRDANGNIEFDFSGDTEVHWDTQETTTNEAGQPMVTDEYGDEFPVSECTVVDDDYDFGAEEGEA